MNAKELFGKEVIDANAKIIGYIKDVDLDIKKWTVTGIIVKSGFIKKQTILAADIDKIGDKVVLKVTGKDLQKT